MRRHVEGTVQRVFARRLRGGRLRRRLGRLAALLLPLEKGVLLELPLHIGRELKIAQLQQLYRLLQLRRHHQGLALTHIQS